MQTGSGFCRVAPLARRQRPRQRCCPDPKLHAPLLRIARSEVRRRSGQLKISGPELDDIAHQAANDALMAIIAKTGQFRGDSRFTTWAFKFVMFEASTKIGRHFWRNPTAPIDAEHWERLPNRLALDPAHETEWRELVAALHRLIDTVLTNRQRRIFVSIVLNEVPRRRARRRTRLKLKCHLQGSVRRPTGAARQRSSLMGIWTTAFEATVNGQLASGSLPADRSSGCGMRGGDGMAARLRRVGSRRPGHGVTIPGDRRAPACLRPMRGGLRGVAGGDRASRDMSRQVPDTAAC